MNLFSVGRPKTPDSGVPPDGKRGETGPNSAELEVGTWRDRKTVKPQTFICRCLIGDTVRWSIVRLRADRTGVAP
jgi:hypothetical protein